MFDIFSGLFNMTLFTLRFKSDESKTLKVVAYATLNTAIRAVAFGGFTYGAIRVVATAVSHGSF